MFWGSHNLRLSSKFKSIKVFKQVLEIEELRISERRVCGVLKMKKIKKLNKRIKMSRTCHQTHNLKATTQSLSKAARLVQYACKL